MTKDEAQAHVQKLLAQAQSLLEEAAKTMDEHQFSTYFMGQSYFPRGLKLVPMDGEDGEEDDDYTTMRPEAEDMDWMWFTRHKYDCLAGKWRSSSQWMEC